MIPDDPLLLMSGALNRMKDGLAVVQPAATDGAALVWARLAASPLSEAGQSPAFAAIRRASASVRREFPGFSVAYTGINRFAAASRERIEREVAWLNAFSLAAVLAVALTFIRGVHRGLHLIPVVLFSVLGAWVGATMAFDRLHIIVLVVGSLLTGVSIDYGFYLFMQAPAWPGEDYWAKVRRLRAAARELPHHRGRVSSPPALGAPFIRQLGVFVAAGLLSALAAALIYFSTVENPFLEAARFATANGCRRECAVGSAGSSSQPGLSRFRDWRSSSGMPTSGSCRSLAGPRARGRAHPSALRRPDRADRLPHLRRQRYGGTRLAAAARDMAAQRRRRSRANHRARPCGPDRGGQRPGRPN